MGLSTGQAPTGFWRSPCVPLQHSQGWGAAGQKQSHGAHLCSYKSQLTATNKTQQHPRTARKGQVHCMNPQAQGTQQDTPECPGEPILSPEPQQSCSPCHGQPALPRCTEHPCHRWKSPSHGTGLEAPRRHWEHRQKSSTGLSTGRAGGDRWLGSPTQGHQKSPQTHACPGCPFHSKAAAASGEWGNDDSAIRASARRQETQVC